jgi:hypothetical protein
MAFGQNIVFTCVVPKVTMAMEVCPQVVVIGANFGQACYSPYEMLQVFAKYF